MYPDYVFVNQINMCSNDSLTLAMLSCYTNDIQNKYHNKVNMRFAITHNNNIGVIGEYVDIFNKPHCTTQAHDTDVECLGPNITTNYVEHLTRIVQQ